MPWIFHGLNSSNIIIDVSAMMNNHKPKQINAVFIFVFMMKSRK